MVFRVTLAMLLAGCFNPDLSNTEIHCEATGACPFGLVCASDGVCRPTMGIPDGGGSGDGSGTDGGQSSCPDQDLGSALGSPVATGNLRDFDDDVRGCMSGFNANDATFGWVAPADARFRITTCGSDYDSVLFIEEDCNDTNQLACDDDSCPMGGPRELIDIDLTAGQSVIIVVGGFDGERGNFELNIEQL